MEQADVERWIEAYVRAWSSSNPADIGALFTNGAAYYTAPYREPWRRRQGIIDGWLEREDDAGNWEFRYEVQAVAGDVAFVRGWTRYMEPPVTYSNLWVIRLEADGRCSEFTEWWMEEKPPRHTT
jgi:SnoaL-like protein